MVDRWRPCRAGIRNVWEYDDQVFTFADGRLVLRGPNGSGKSNALALLMPFLLDGVMAATRMDSLGGGRSMKTLLLCLNEDERAGRFRHDKRTGYVWLEFDREGAFLTIGCGARASAQRDADAWFFVTDRRPGIDIDLAPGGIPLARSALIEELGSRNVFDTADAYRTAIDKALFGLGDHRYKNLLELLLVLRRPHLAGKLNLDLLSKVLSDGLAPLDDELIGSVAASFEDLEAVQRDLRRVRHAQKVVQTFLPVYRRYLRAIARARSAAAADADRATKLAERQVREAAAALDEVRDEIRRLDEATRSNANAVEIARQRHRAILDSPAYKDARSLITEEEHLISAERAERRAANALEKAETETAEATGALASAETDVRAATTALDEAFVTAATSADVAGVAWPVSRPDVEATADLRRFLDAGAMQRRADVREVRRALQAAETANGQARQATAQAEQSEAAAAAADQARRGAAGAVEAARSALADAVATWAATSDLSELAGVPAAVGRLGDPVSPSLPSVVAEALQERRSALAAQTARAEDDRRRADEERATLISRRRAVEAAPIPTPERLLTRPADRTGRSGAPLYACCDFAESVGSAERAGVEAALDAAGLLDSWVGAPSDDLDAWVTPGAPVSGPSLADVLVADPPEGVAATVIDEILRSVALADAGIAVLADGRFALGPLTGRFVKTDAELIGATAREQRRRRLLSELDEQIATIDARLAELAAEQDTIVAEHNHIDDVVANLPSAGPLLEARRRLDEAIGRAKQAKERSDLDVDSARQYRRLAEEAATRLRAEAGQRNLPPTADGLGQLDERIRDYEHRCSLLAEAASALGNHRKIHSTAAARVHRADADERATRRALDDRHRESSGLRARIEELRANLGDDVEAPIRTLGQVEAELRTLDDVTAQLTDERQQSAKAEGAAEQKLTAAHDAVTDRKTDGEAAARRLEVLRHGDIWAVAGDGEHQPTDPVDLAARVLAVTADSSAAPDGNALQRAFRSLLDELGRGYDPSLTFEDEVGIATVTSETATTSVLWLGDELATQVAAQEQLLTERDRQIFERHLLTRVAEALRQLLNDADELVGRINGLLAGRPTASGKTVHLKWEAATADPTVRKAIDLLRRTPELLGPADREELQRFFKTAIDQRRSEDIATGYAQILRSVLDYRTWHTFVPSVRSAGGGVQRLTPTLFRSLSGGEQAVVLHLPLFAAAAAHYDAAREGAPRTIALDEAFAGIDEGMRAELMGLLVKFDLDVVLTGHELWGTYDQVPALMAYDLLRRPPEPGVSAFAIRWDGNVLAEA